LKTLPLVTRRKFLRSIRPTVLSADNMAGALDLNEYCIRPHVSVSVNGEASELDLSHCLVLKSDVPTAGLSDGSLPPDAARVHGRARPSDAYLRHVNQNRVAVGDQ
jgi:hypothetical protein